ncbi:hypothetical protein L873DRAFT_774802 [Choiromyces venosus 120613-1]|uniref:Uncharacterized protein n=1 Tax=Choiromyces venosus 120613-1 TaxID=1336337 RepID=A0A3N4JTF1_9PEZI|nr:hypothetical protein L873DRAFT_774802 [Choiromyces venosus 120613-1]
MVHSTLSAYAGLIEFTESMGVVLLVYSMRERNSLISWLKEDRDLGSRPGKRLPVTQPNMLLKSEVLADSPFYCLSCGGSDMCTNIAFPRASECLSNERT